MNQIPKYKWVISTVALLLQLALICIFYSCITTTMSDESAKTVQYIKNIKNENSIKNKQLLEKTQTYLKDTSKCATDSVIKQLIVDAHADYNCRLDNVLADLRQEFNNQLDTLNIYMAIWIAVISMFGGLLPLILTLWTKNDVEQKVENAYKERLGNFDLAFESKLSLLKVEFSATKTNLENLFTLKEQELQSNYDKLVSDYQKLDADALFHQIYSLIGCIASLKELHLKYHMQDLKDYLKVLLSLLYSKNEKYIHSITQVIKTQDGWPGETRFRQNEYLIYLLQTRQLIKSLELYFIMPQSLRILLGINDKLDKLMMECVALKDGCIIPSATLCLLYAIQADLLKLLSITDRDLPLCSRKNGE